MGVRGYRKYPYFYGMYERGKVPDKMRNQFRSWRIMEEYFGIIQPGAVTIPLTNLPPHIQEAFKKLQPFVKRVRAYEAKRIKLN